MATEKSCGQLDLGPRRVGIHFRKLACRSDAVDEVLTDGGVTGQDFGARARSTGPPHQGTLATLGGSIRASLLAESGATQKQRSSAQ